MRIVLAGGSGFLGGALAGPLARSGHDIWILSRTAGSDSGAPIHRVHWTPDGTSGAWASVIDGADAVVNLSGAGIADKRWTRARKRELVTSRLESTRSLVAAVEAARARPSIFIQNTAVGYYGFVHGDEPLDERSAPGGDFLARLCVDWQVAAVPVTGLGCRLVVFRTGVVLARDGGALPMMMLPFRFFVGGRMGSGRQYLSWIHIDDWVAMVTWAITSSTLTGAVNATAPEPATNTELAKAIGAALHRPGLVPAPAFALRLAVGELADAALLGGQRVLPHRAEQLGFTFKHRDVRKAVHSLVGH